MYEVTFCFCRLPCERPRCHPVRKAVAENQRVEQYRIHVGEKSQEQKIREDRVRFRNVAQSSGLASRGGKGTVPNITIG